MLALEDLKWSTAVTRLTVHSTSGLGVSYVRSGDCLVIDVVHDD